ncbi:MAG: hypothetical protein GWN58_68250, partial [Anaerolineae bacterium]|nr:hypothetical protein [Anaerolineae bacterium]
CTASNTPNWVEQVVDLSAYAGLSVPLRFLADTSLSASSWYIDDVSFEVSAATADAGIRYVPDPGLPPARKVKSPPD